MKKELEQMRILVVDDIAKNVQLVAKILSKFNFQIAYATNGNDALNLVCSEQFDLILLDVMMPEMDGFEVCKKIKQLENYLEVPVLFLTAKTDIDNITEGFKSGGVDYIAKPFYEDELISRIQTHLELRFKSHQLKTINQVLELKVKERTLQLEQAIQKLEILDRAKSDFIKIISHELRTPLNGIIGFSHLLKNNKKIEIEPRFMSLLDISAARLLKITEMSELITSLKTKKYSLNFDYCPVDRLIKDVQSIAKSNEYLQKINVDFVKHDDVENIFCDNDLITQSLIFLLENVAKHGSLSGNPKALVEFAKEGDRYMLITVNDEGPGFSESILNNFEHHFNLDEVKHHSEGLGLSFSTIKLIMDAHQGLLLGENNQKGGARVTLKVPMV